MEHQPFAQNGLANVCLEEALIRKAVMMGHDSRGSIVLSKVCPLSQPKRGFQSQTKVHMDLWHF